MSTPSSQTTSADSVQPLIELRNVSKQFRRFRAQRSIQQWFIDLIGRGIRKSSSRPNLASNDQAADSTGGENKDSFWPLRNISFSVNRGERIGIIGYNGTGKSTLLKLITGILEPTEGEIIVNGRVSSLLELGAGFHPDLTGRENIVLNATLHGLKKKTIEERLDTIVQFAGLDDFVDTPVKHYSSGMYMRLGFAVAIHTDPDLLIVDEVLAVGDATFQKKCMSAIHDFCRRGGTLILVTHDLNAVETICSKAIWMERGVIQQTGRPIDVVMSYLSATSRKESDGPNPNAASAVDARRSGNGKVRFERVELCDSSGQPTQHFEHGDGMEIHMHYRRYSEVEPPVIGIGIHHENGTHITGPNTAFAEMQLPNQQEGLLIYRIPTLSLLPGTYLVSVAAIHGDTQETYDMHDRLYEFQIDHGSTRERYGLIALNGDWAWQPTSHKILNDNQKNSGEDATETRPQPKHSHPAVDKPTEPVSEATPL